MAQQHLGLFDTPPGRQEVRIALATAGLLLAYFLGVLPFVGVRLPENDIFIPTINATIFVSDLIISAIFYAQASVFRSRALVVLASSYLASALLTFFYVLSFPGAFAPGGLVSGGFSTAAWIAFLRLWAFPAAVIPYALLRSAESAAPTDAERAPAPVLSGVFTSVALAVLLAALAIFGHGLLPPLFSDRRSAIYSHLIVANATTILFTGAALITLFRRRKSVLDIWLLVALAGWFLQHLLNLPLRERFSLGWYGLNGLILISNLIVMLALVAESNRLYARLALSTAARDREHQVRLMSMDAVAAAIAHEVGQPLAAVNLSAKAGLTWLTRAPPDLERAVKSLRDTLDAGQRSVDVIKSIRQNFGSGPRGLSEFNLNDLASETASLLDRELAARGVSLQLSLDEALPSISANRVQVQRVLVNLLTNSIDALGATRRRGRRIAIRSAAADGRNVLLEVSDTGGGIAPEALGRIFDPFFTTKSTGTGLGLSLSRTIVEAHGGRLWVTSGQGEGATFHLQLPIRPKLAAADA